MMWHPSCALALLAGACSVFISAAGVASSTDVSASTAHTTRTEQAAASELWMQKMSSRIDDLVPDSAQRSRILRLIYDTSNRYDVDPVVVLALVTVESKFKPRAVSKTGALGLMQVMPFWMKEIGHPSDDLFDLPTNVAYGCAILKRYLMLAEGNLSKALADYNGGGDPQYTEKVLHQLNTRFTR